MVIVGTSETRELPSRSVVLANLLGNTARDDIRPRRGRRLDRLAIWWLTRS